MGALDGIKTFVAGTLKNTAKGGLKGFLWGLAATAAVGIGGGLLVASFITTGWVAALAGGTIALATMVGGLFTSIPITTKFGAGLGGIFGGAKEWGEEAKRIEAREDSLQKAKDRIAARHGRVERQLHELHEHANNNYDGMTREQLMAENAAMRQQMMQQGQGMGNYGQQHSGSRPSPMDLDYHQRRHSNQQGQQGYSHATV